MIAPVMVVDDEAMVRKSLAQAIERSGAEVITASDREEALAKFREMRNPLVFADVRMPGTGGVALLRSVKSLAPDTTVVLITGFATQELAAEAAREGASRLLCKPFTLDEIRGILSDTLGGLAGESPLSYVGTGRDIPGDLDPAEPRRLIRRTLQGAHTS
jgi:DNA-binding NtrC family response regulator